MKTMSHREYRTRLAWLEDQWEQPSRTDNYLMQIALEVARMMSRNKGAYNIGQFLLKFGREKKKVVTEQQAEQSKQSWLSRIVGGFKSGE
jgi:hypothetical protein|tara:strand:- start:1132 stop:1401 length:270 start_codon:yes stop_codon:yes gene_type:complete